MSVITDCSVKTCKDLFVQMMLNNITVFMYLVSLFSLDSLNPSIVF